MTGVQVALGYYQQSQTSGDYVFCAQHRKGTHFTGAMILDTATVYLHLAVAIGAVLAAFCRVQCGNGAHTRGMLTRQYIYTGVLVALWGLEVSRAQCWCCGSSQLHRYRHNTAY
eukprot:m.126938 g.126938  ORF g.126938 m.126938 type:complete len:114 (+) comp13846_c1_seq7:775-1116(+)